MLTDNHALVHPQSLFVCSSSLGGVRVASEWIGFMFLTREGTGRTCLSVRKGGKGKGKGKGMATRGCKREAGISHLIPSILFHPTLSCLPTCPVQRVERPHHRRARDEHHHATHTSRVEVVEGLPRSSLGLRTFYLGRLPSSANMSQHSQKNCPSWKWMGWTSWD